MQVLRKDSSMKVAFELGLKASKKLGQVNMYLKDRAHEKNGLILEAEAEMYFQRGINSKSCIECGRNSCAREQESEKKGGGA